MIVRVLQARVSAANTAFFNDQLRAELTRLQAQPGLVYAKLARRLTDHGDEEVVLFEEWRTPADLWAWTEGRLATSRLLPDTEHLTQDLVISHYEAIDLSPEELDLRVMGLDPVISETVHAAVGGSAATEEMSDGGSAPAELRPDAQDA